ncbi:MULTISPECIES: hypothetical protein [unclassified Streptomyces]|uniref:hypothetical protein n=1 Tax=unclassified Streptomyces TaxID=2593676 RepID=UPI002E177088|nr:MULTISPECIES: hypothetical protein [unclassified Streptomyces]
MVDPKMTEEFASAMVTVIPIIGLVATVEVSSHFSRYLEMLERGEGDMYSRRATTGAVKGWVLIGAAHVVAEWMLVEWLVSTDRPESPKMAMFIAITGCVGFAWALVFPMMSMVDRLLLAQAKVRARRQAAVREARSEPEAGPQEMP